MNRLAALLLVVSLIAVPVTAQTMTTIDADHGLTSDAAKASFEQDGVASTSLTAPDVTITIASELSQCGIEDWTVSDVRNDFVCLEYDEEVDRTLRFFVPNEYWHPYVRETVDPVHGDVTASYEPVQDAEFTAVTATVEEPTTIVWPVNAESSWFAERRDSTIANVEKLTGVGVAEAETWQYAMLSGNETGYSVRAPNGTDALTLEYNTTDGWVTVPTEETSYAPVYAQEYEGRDDRVVLITTNSSGTPLDVRYKTDSTSTDRIGAALREIGQVDDRLEEVLHIDIPFFGDDSEEDNS